MVKIIYCIICYLFCFTAISGTIHPEISDVKYIEFGKKFTYVYKLCGEYKDNTLFCASSVAIDPNFLLTAAHVVQEAKICAVKNDKNEKICDVTEIIINQNFEHNNYGFYDIAILYIEKPLDITFYPELYDLHDEANQLCTISGYGLTGDFETGSTRGDGIRRAGSNKIDKIENHLLICEPSNNNKTLLEFLIASGDSGGGLFIGNKLAGINSCIMTSDKKPNSNYGDESGHTRISIHKEWIKNIIERKKNEK